MVDYVQSVIAATAPQSDHYIDLDESTWNDLASRVSELFNSLMSFFICQSSHRKLTGLAYGDRLEALFTQLEMIWVFVRGDRHGAHHIPHLADLLAPHDAAIEDVYGLRVADITAGLRQIRENLGRGIHDAISSLQRVGFDPEGRAGVDRSSAADQPRLETCLPDGSVPPAPDLGSTGAHLLEVVERLFGYHLFDVGKATGWPDALIRDLSWEPGEEADFFAPGESPGSPLRVWPIFKRPFLAVNGRSYCFEPASLFDHFYRVLQRAVCRAKPEYVEVWNRAQNGVSEGLPLRFLAEILKGSEVYQNAYYRTQEWTEVDGIILCGDVLFVVEVKAGAFIRDPPATDFESYFRAISDLLTKPARQAHRFLSALKQLSNVQLFDRAHSKCLRVLSNDEVRVCVPLCVTLDNVSHLAARSFAMSAVDPDIALYPSWILSIDDLRVFKDIFLSPGIFCHFAEQRMKAAKNNSIPVIDEMDHLGLYISENQYVEAFEQFEGRMGFHGFAGKIDEYYYDLEFGDAPSSPPAQKMPYEIRSAIFALDRKISASHIHAASVLLDFGAEGREQITGQIRELQHKSKLKARGVILAIASEYIPITNACDGPAYAMDRERLNDEARAELLRQKADQRLVMLLQYDSSDHLHTAEAWFLRRGDISPEEGRRLEPISDEQAWRRLSRRKLSRVGRNESCPCGSGRKFKRCCMNRR